MDNDMVLLGLLDEKIGRHSLTWTTSKLGGNPNWINGSVEFPKCGECTKVTSFIAQIYCPLEGAEYDRTLYIFVCCNQSCWNNSKSWRVFRGQKINEQYVKEKTKVTSKVKSSLFEVEDDWGEADNAGDLEGVAHDVFGANDPINEDTSPIGVTESSTKTGTCYTAEKFKQMSIAEVDRCSAVDSYDGVDNDEHFDDSEPLTECLIEDFPIVPESEVLKDLLSGRIKERRQDPVDVEEKVEFQSYFISVVEEPSEANSTSKHEYQLMQRYNQSDEFPADDNILKKSKIKGFKEDSYESSSTRHGDKIFYKFQKRIARCPEQILRYSWNGVPLFITNYTEGSVPPCPSCGAKRVFELQMLPSLVNFLMTNKGSREVLEFGNVIIYSCPMGCWSDKMNTYLEEVVVIQADPDLNFL